MEEQKQDETLQEEVTQIEEVTEVPESVEVESNDTHTIEAATEPAKKEVSKTLLQQVKSIGAPIPVKLDELRQFIVECRRVLRVTKKPDRDEYKTIVKISAIGIAVIGLVGFIVHLAKELLF